jgi:hypothetical protein
MPAARASRSETGEDDRAAAIQMNIEPLRLETGEATGDGLEGLANCFEMVQAFSQTEVGEVVGA